MVNDPTWIALIAYGSGPRSSVGDRGVHVVRLQRALRAAGYKTLTGTGYYGSQTVTAVKKVQRGNGFKATGIVGPKFWTPAAERRAQAGQEAPSPRTVGVASSKGSNKGAIALAFAKRQLGDSYGYGGTGPNRWDCSGLTQGAYKAAGVKLPHSARGQMKYGNGDGQDRASSRVTWCSSTHRSATWRSTPATARCSTPPVAGQAGRLHQDGLHAVRGGPPHRVSASGSAHEPESGHRLTGIRPRSPQWLVLAGARAPRIAARFLPFVTTFR